MTIQEFIIRLFLVAVIGLIIGIERQIGGHHIELKTTFLIAVGTFSFCMIEILLGYPDIRMSANIVTGIGFLCSGVIFKNSFTVNGLNTSATLWSTAGISILVAYGYFKYAFIITLTFVISMSIYATVYFCLTLSWEWFVPLIVLIWLNFIFLLYMHRSNIKRLAAGKENEINFREKLFGKKNKEEAVQPQPQPEPQVEKKEEEEEVFHDHGEEE